MNEMTATTLMDEKTNSASAYPRTPNELMKMMMMRKMVTNMSLFIEADQYDNVKVAAMSSRGRMMSHWRA